LILSRGALAATAPVIAVEMLALHFAGPGTYCEAHRNARLYFRVAIKLLSTAHSFRKGNQQEIYLISKKII